MYELPDEDSARSYENNQHEKRNFNNTRNNTTIMNNISLDSF